MLPHVPKKKKIKNKKRKDFADVLKLRIMKWRDYPELLGELSMKSYAFIIPLRKRESQSVIREEKAM